MHVEILKDWNEVLAVNKESGWLTIPGRGNKEGVPVLSNILGAQLRQSTLRASANDLFIVHRLDLGTSGVILFTRSKEAHRKLSLQFENHEVRKTYWALVKGTLSEQTLFIDKPLFKLPSKKIKSVVDPKGKPSQTEIITLASAHGYSLIEARPLTGRSHQIRVHLAAVGLPLVGDPLYGGPTEVLGHVYPTPLLHARALEFSWPEGQKKEAYAPLPVLFLEVVRSIGMGENFR